MIAFAPPAVSRRSAETAIWPLVSTASWRTASTPPIGLPFSVRMTLPFTSPPPELALSLAERVTVSLYCGFVLGDFADSVMSVTVVG